MFKESVLCILLSFLVSDGKTDRVCFESCACLLYFWWENMIFWFYGEFEISDFFFQLNKVTDENINKNVSVPIFVHITCKVL